MVDATPASMIDGEGAARPVVACVGALVHDAHRRLLLIRRGQEPHRGLWSLPGGRVEPGETAEQAIVREVHEETGLAVIAGAVVGRVRIDSAAAVYDVVDLACVLTTADQVPVAGDDAADVRFADAATLVGLECTPGLIEILRDWAVLPD
jgi:ADP-ribose pyrophosphatase YjhB (NUDIX family)